jgi:hypothetical protein
MYHTLFFNKLNNRVQLLNFALQYVIKRAQVNQVGVKLNGRHQLLVYVDYVNILDGSVRTLKNTEALVIASKEIRLEVNAGHTEHIFMSRDQKQFEVTV